MKNTGWFPSRVDKLLFTLRAQRNLPKSEKWFWDKWRASGMEDEADKSNEELLSVFPDVSNRKYKYVIEVDGAHHQDPFYKAKDEIRDRNFTKNGYTVFRIKAYNEEQFSILVDWVRDLRERTRERKKKLAHSKHA